MRRENVHDFTDREEQFIDLLSESGVPVNPAKVVTFLARAGAATQAELDQGADMRLTDIIRAEKYLHSRGWLQCPTGPSKKCSRTVKTYTLSIPVDEIVAAVEEENHRAIALQIGRFRMIRKSLSD